VTIEIRFEVTPAEGRADEFVGRAEFTNTGDVAVAVMAMQLESASLALEIDDAEGNPVPLPPPPVPDPSARPVELAPGEARQVTYPGFLPVWTEPGRYRVRARLVGEEPAVSASVEVNVVG
jgi:hypothetical protein